MTYVMHKLENENEWITTGLTPRSQPTHQISCSIIMLLVERSVFYHVCEMTIHPLARTF